MPSGNNNQEGNTPDANQEEEENVAGGLKKRIRSLHDLDHFQVSHTYNEFLGFILSLNDAVLGKPLSFPCQTSPVCLSYYYFFRANYIILFILY